MRGQTSSAIGAILLGALETAGEVQELINQGIIRNRTYPLAAGTLGTIAGVLLLASGIALLFDTPKAKILVEATAYVSIPVFLLIGVITRIAGWPITLAGLGFPLVLLLLGRKAQVERQ